MSMVFWTDCYAYLSFEICSVIVDLWHTTNIPNGKLAGKTATSMCIFCDVSGSEPTHQIAAGDTRVKEADAAISGVPCLARAPRHQQVVSDAAQHAFVPSQRTALELSVQ